MLRATGQLAASVSSAARVTSRRRLDWPYREFLSIQSVNRKPFKRTDTVDLDWFVASFHCALGHWLQAGQWHPER